MFKGSYDLIKAIIEKVQLPAGLKMLLIAIADHWSKDNPNPFPEYTTLVAEAGMPKRTLPRKLKALKEAGWLEWEHGKGRSNIYTLAIEKIEALSATVALPEMARPDLALPHGEVAPKLGTQVAPKLGTLTNKEQTIYNKQRVEPNEQAGSSAYEASHPYIADEDETEADNNKSLPATSLESASEDKAGYIKPIPAKSLAFTPTPASPNIGEEPEEGKPEEVELPPGWNVGYRKEDNTWFACHLRDFINLGPFRTKAEAIAKAMEVYDKVRMMNVA